MPQYRGGDKDNAKGDAEHTSANSGQASNQVLGYVPPLTKQQKKAQKLKGEKMVMDQGKQFAVLDWDAAIRQEAKME